MAGKTAVLVFLIAAYLVFGTSVAAAPPAKGESWKPKMPGQGIQAGVMSEVSGIERAEMLLDHACPIQLPSVAGAAYSYSLVGVTDQDFVVRMGYIVLQSDGPSATCYLTPNGGSLCCSGWAHWFVQVLRPDGSEAYWKLSRAGEANPPPANSCSSGDTTCEGYPFSLGRVAPNTWNFWFDWISKARVRVPGSGSFLKKVYYLGEVSGTNGVSGSTMGPRTALTTFRVYPGTGSGGWSEPAVAQAVYFNVLCDGPYGVESPGLGPTRSNGVQYQATAVGSGVDDLSCTDNTVWP